MRYIARTLAGLYADELDFARDLAAELGQWALEQQRQGLEQLDTREKPRGGGPVTRADIEANARIVAAIRKHFPEDGIIAEESAARPTRPDSSRAWIIDPIDGTREFSQGLDAWAVHIGLAVDGVPAMGVVALPARDALVWGAPDEGRAWVQRGSAPPEALAAPEHGVAAPRIVASASRYSPRVAALSDTLAIPEEHRLRSGSAGVKMTMLALGQAEIYAHGSAGLSLWDTCAPGAILRAAGGSLSDLRGRPLDHHFEPKTHPGGLLATRGVDHEALAETLRRIGSDWFVDGRLLPDR